MPVRTWAAATAAAALLAAHTATAAATDNVETDPPPTPTPTPTPVPGLPELPDVAGSVIYVVTVTTTITTTTTTAPITVVAAPITTTVNNNTDNTTNNSTSTSTQAAPGAAGAESTSSRGRMEINLRGCRRRGAAGARFARMQTQLRVPRGTRLVVRVNGRQVGVLDLDAGNDATAKPIPLRISVRRDGMLSIYRPSGRVLETQGCSAR
jgi:hypothetical protein